MYVKVEESGTGVFHGNVKVRLAMSLEPGDARYGEHFVRVPVIPPEGYPGEVKERNIPTNQADFDSWFDSLPKVWQNNPFHNHLIYADPDITDAEIKSQMEFHLPNFYRAWSEGRTIRSGWATKTRVRPLRYDKVEEPANFALREAQCLVRANAIKLSNLSASSLSGGSAFPATNIDMGPGAIDRGYSYTYGDLTLIVKQNLANDTGVIDTFEIWMGVASNITMGTAFESPTAPDFTFRDFEYVGHAATGSKQTFSGLDCDAVTGDYLGCYTAYHLAKIQAVSSANTVYTKYGNQTGAGSQTYGSEHHILSLYATGETPGDEFPAGDAAGR